MKTFFFMAGLPRAGSTLLSALLNQNPQIHATANSPVLTLMSSIEQFLKQDEMFNADPRPDSAHSVIAKVIQGYHSDVSKPIVIDKNRGWVSHVDFIRHYLNIEPKIICPVRNMDEVLASFIAMHRRNGMVSSTGRLNFIDTQLVQQGIALTDDERCKFLAGQGIVGSSYSNLRDALAAGHDKYVHLVEYDDLVNSPQETLNRVYDFLELDRFEHDFTSVSNTRQERDAEVHGFKDMHHVRKIVGKTSIEPKDILSEEILANCKGAEFWRDLEPNEGEQ